jgi:ketosteroid isomerase-like protein
MKHLSVMTLAAILTATGAGVPLLNAAAMESDGEQEITVLCEKYSSAYKGKDATAIARLFSGRNIVLMPPNASAAVGPEAVKSRYQSFFDSPGSEPTGAEKLEVGGELRDWAHVGDLLVITASNENYKYLVVLVRQPDTGWKIAPLIWNGNR